MAALESVEIDFDYGTLRYPSKPRELTSASCKAGINALELTDGKVQISRDGEELCTLSTGLKDQLVGMSFSEEGESLAVASIRGVSVFAIDTENGSTTPVGTYRPYTFKHELLGRLLQLEDHIPRFINGVTMSVDGSLVAIGIQNSWDQISSLTPGYGIVKVLDAKTLEQRSEHLVADSPKALAFSPDNAELLIEVKARGEHRVKL